YEWSHVSESSTGLPAPGVEPHLLLERVTDLAEWDDVFAARLTREVLEAAVDQVPDDLLLELEIPSGRSTGAMPRLRRDDGDLLRRRRAAYVAFLWKRLKAPRAWVGAQPAGPARVRRGPPSWLTDRAR